ncbi:uncharacterized protein PHALS_03187 [Plasmopara halstedii]|uniref:Uncharacterized protein n=1 Tax=Plasmopara halstedii TaxID=4781 RepID=A0A0P1AZ58_PLAHL|nr:uncharacterized protein PHALS_03187 [Plasmopara halstedii]CEG46586.1 hypothetical protein PHALS_03187 [Plasmopara halstedii]|eukprot:XP_024582955.1 hypothetical protein PHALS_03187 [Plasmopara halstedii]
MDGNNRVCVVVYKTVCHGSQCLNYRNGLTYQCAAFIRTNNRDCEPPEEGTSADFNSDGSSFLGVTDRVPIVREMTYNGIAANIYSLVNGATKQSYKISFFALRVVA